MKALPLCRRRVLGAGCVGQASWRWNWSWRGPRGDMGQSQVRAGAELEWLSTYGVSVASLVQAALAGWLGLQLKTVQSIGEPLGIGSRCGQWGVPGTSHGAGMGLRPSAHTGCIGHWPEHLSCAPACVTKGESEGRKWHFPGPLIGEHSRSHLPFGRRLGLVKISFPDGPGAL